MHPGAERRATRDLRAGLEKGDRGIVVNGFGEHGADHADLISHARRMREQIAKPGACLAVLFEWENRTGQWNGSLLRGHAGQTLTAADMLGKLFAIQFVEQWFVIEQIHLRGRAALK